MARGPASCDAPWGTPRLGFAAAAMVTIAAGLASRRFAGILPGFVADYAGDTLWATTAFLAIGLLTPGTAPGMRALAAMAAAAAVEVSQLYHAPWLDDIRRTVPGTLLLGSGFLWSDLACYAVGVLLGAIGERAARMALGPGPKDG